MTIPVRAVLVKPVDLNLPAPLWQCRNKCLSWLRRMQTYVRQETGCRFDFTFTYLASKYTHLELATENNGNVRLDECGQGIDEGQIWWKCFREELAMDPTPPYRWTAFVIGAGGWAGGRNNLPNIDEGMCLIGDWNLTANVGAKVCDPCCAQWHGMNSPVCMADGDGWSHEMLHLFGTDCHNPSVYPFAGDGLTVERKLQLITKNQPFLRDT